jgi:MFS family permease
VAGITLFSLATILIALAPTLWLLIGLRALQGVGAAMISVTGIAIIAAVFPPAERGRAIGITVAAVYTGLSSGPFAAGYLSAVWGWRSVFTVTFPVGLLSIYLAMAMIKDEWTPARGQRLDVAGICLYGLSLILFMPGLSNMPSSTGFILLFASLVPCNI